MADNVKTKKRKALVDDLDRPFKFKRFHEHVESLSVSVYRDIRRGADVPEEGSDTFVDDAFKKWSSLNCTAHYKRFCSEFVWDVGTLPQIILYKDEIVDCLLKHLEVPDSMAYDAILEIVVALAQDLQCDFYPYFPRFLEGITKQVKLKDVDSLEASFKCLSCLFMSLWRYMIKDLPNVVKLYCPFLEDKYKRVKRFASESIAFLLRKVEDKSYLLHLLFSMFDSHPHITSGLGDLLFEVQRGAQYSFNTFANTFFHTVLCKLGTGTVENGNVYNWKSVYVCVETMLGSMLAWTNRDHVDFVWDAFEKLFQELRGGCLEKKSRLKSLRHLSRILHLYRRAVQFDSGKLVRSVEEVQQVTFSLLAIPGLARSCWNSLLRVVSFLLFRAPKCAEVEGARLAAQVFAGCDLHDLVIGFVKENFRYKAFERDLLPHYLRSCHSIFRSAEDDGARWPVASDLADLVLLKRPPGAGVGQPKRFKRYPVDFSSCGAGADDEFAQFLSRFLQEDCLDRYWSALYTALIFVPHLRKDSAVVLCDKVKTLYAVLLDRAKCQDVDDNVTFLLCCVAETLIYCCDWPTVREAISVADLVDLLRKFSSDVYCLRLVNSYFTFLKKKIPLEESTLLTLYQILVANLSSPFHQIRLLTLHLFTLFPVTLSESSHEDKPVNIFKLCLQLESCEYTVTNARECEVLLLKLRHEFVSLALPPDSPFVLAPLHFAVGALYQNFRPLWQPARDVIESYAFGIVDDAFWVTYLGFLDQAALRAEGHTPEGVPHAGFDQTLFGRHKQILGNLSDRTNPAAHRKHLWEVLPSFVAIVGRHQEAVVELFFRFVRNECGSLDVTDFKCVNLLDRSVSRNRFATRKPRLGRRTEPKKKREAVASEPDDDDDTFGEALEIRGLGFGKGVNVKVLGYHLEVFAKLPDPRALSRERDLLDIYLTVLRHPSSQLQALALRCIAAYKFDYLTPYAELLFDIVEGKELTRNLARFSLSDVKCAIQEEHRKQLFPILVRILLAKMEQPVTDKVLRNRHVKFMYMVILRYMLYARDAEMKLFLELVFLPFRQFLNGDVCRLVRTIAAARGDNLTRAIPPSKLLRALRIIKYLIVKVKNLLQPHLPFLYKILVTFCARIVLLLNHSRVVDRKQVPLLIRARTLAFSTLLKFFVAFQRYPYARSEVDALFEAVVWTSLLSYAAAGNYQTNFLSKLFVCWSRNPRFFVLLAKCDPEDGSLCPITRLLDAFVSEQGEASVERRVIKLVRNLLLYKDYDPTDSVVDDGEAAPEVPDELVGSGPLVDAGATVGVDRQRFAHLEEPPNYGTLLLLPYLNKIVLKMKNSLPVYDDGEAQDQDRKPSFPAGVLTILMKLSEFVSDPGVCEDMLYLLLPHLKRRLSEETEVKILTIVRHLVKSVEQPRAFVSTFVPLFSLLKNRKSRDVLCEVLEVCGEKVRSLGSIATIALKINSWNVERTDVPDYAMRLTGFSEARACIEQMRQVDGVFCDFVLNSCCYFIYFSEDYSLRHNATDTLEKLLERLAALRERNAGAVATLVHRRILPRIQRGIKNRIEEVRNAFLGLMSSLVGNFAALPKFAELQWLVDRRRVERDFFENMRHIQLARRTDALQRLLQSDQLPRMHPRTLTQFVLPIASGVLFREDYVTEPSLVHVAVQVIQKVCGLIPWPAYHSNLLYFLGKVETCKEFPKMAVKVFVAVMDAFHFDVSMSEETEESLKAFHLRQIVKLRRPNKLLALTDGSQATSSSTEVLALCEGKSQVPLALPGPPGQSLGLTGTCTDVVAAAASSSKQLALPSSVSGDGVVALAAASSAARSKVTRSNVRLANDIHRSIVNHILPRLERLLHDDSHKHFHHRLAPKSQLRENRKLIVRIPILAAVVKLVHQLDHSKMQAYLSRIFARIAALMRSHDPAVRIVARQTLIRIIETVGPRHIPAALDYLKGILVRGYDVHILIFTVHNLLNAVLPQLRPGVLDRIVPALCEMSLTELFGKVGEEKSVQKFVTNLKEAKGIKSYTIYGILGKFVSQPCLVDFLVPLKNVLMGTTNASHVAKIQKCLEKAAVGIVENSSLTPANMLLFAYGVATESMPGLSQSPARLALQAAAEPSPDSDRFVRPDSFLIPREPGRNRAVAASSPVTNSYVLMQFGIRILHAALRRSKVRMSERGMLEMIDPFVPILNACLKSGHIDITTAALRCLLVVMPLRLPSLRQHIHEVADSMFDLLRKFCGRGVAYGDNATMVVSCFKAVTSLMTGITYHKLSDDQVRILLALIENDINDPERRSSAFGLLKVILGKRWAVSEVDAIMSQVMQMSVSNELVTVRTHCRQCTALYLRNSYGEGLTRHMLFLARQLEYEHASGRLSALRTLVLLFGELPQSVVSKNAACLFVPMAAKLVNDESAACRKAIGRAIRSLVERVDEGRRLELFAFVKSWLYDDVAAHTKLACRLCSIFLDAFRGKLNEHVAEVLPGLVAAIDPAKHDNFADEDSQRSSDELLFQVLSTSSKMLRNCAVLKRKAHEKDMLVFWGHVSELLLYPHAWVQFVSCQLFGQLFAAYPPEVVADTLKAPGDVEEWIFLDFAHKIRKLSLAFCCQTRSICLLPALGDQIAKNLVYVCKLFRALPADVLVVDVEKAVAVRRGVVVEKVRRRRLQLSFDWILKRMEDEAFKELRKPKEVFKRTCFLRWFAAVAVDLEPSVVDAKLGLLIKMLHRELNVKSAQMPEDYTKLVSDVADLVKNVVGVRRFTDEYSKVTIASAESVLRRKRKRALEAVTKPEVAARRKIAGRLKAQEAKRRKSEAMRLADDQRAIDEREKDINVFGASTRRMRKRKIVR